MCQNPDAARVASNEAELRALFARSRYRELASILDFANYFPRSERRALSEIRTTGRMFIAGMSTFGAVLGAGVQAFLIGELRPFTIAVLIAAVLLPILRRRMTFLYAPTSEATKFVEMLCFDPRRPVLYLRQFASEDPLVSTRRARDGPVAWLGNPSGVQALENLSQLLESCGPVLGLGSPSDSSIKHRISRLYTDDSHWREAVRFFLSEAAAVFVLYEPSPNLDWELTKSMEGRHAVFFVLVPDIPEHVARDPDRAFDALPEPLKAAELTREHRAPPMEKYLSESFALLAVVSGTQLRYHAVKMNFHAIWDLLFREIVEQQLSQTAGSTDVPAPYRALHEAATQIWPMGGGILAVLIGFAGGWALFAWLW